MQNQEFGNIEGRRAEKHKLKKWANRVALFVYIIMSWFLLVFFFLSEEAQHGKKPEYLDFIVIDHSAISESTMNVPLYYTVGGFVLFFLVFIFGTKSKAEYEDIIASYYNKKRKVPFGIRMRYKLASKLDNFVYLVMYPLSMFLLVIDSKSKKNRETFYIRYGWMSHLEYSFFKRVIVLKDGYSRVKKLKLFEKYPLLFSKTKSYEEALISKEFQTITSLFKSSESFKDVFMIAEGYIANKGSMKFDKNLSKNEFYQILTNDFDGKIDNFRVFDGKDMIYFSFDLIKTLIDEESKKFLSYWRNYSVSSTGLEYTRMYKQMFQYIKQDKAIKQMLRSLPVPEPLDEDEPLKMSETMKRIEFIFEIYFRFFATFYIINQYINLPAGTVVVRMEDYTLRMITEIYDNKNIVSIEKRKNDGTNESFKGDGLVNMFLLAWNYYNYSVKNSFHSRVYNIFNLRDEDLEAEISGVNSVMSGAMSNDILSFLNTEVPQDIASSKPDVDDDVLEDTLSFILS